MNPSILFSLLLDSPPILSLSLTPNSPILPQFSDLDLTHALIIDHPGLDHQLNPKLILRVDSSPDRRN